MSSYLVSDKTINNIVTLLASNDKIQTCMWDYPFNESFNNDEDFDNFAKDLLRLNYKALGMSLNNIDVKKHIDEYIHNWVKSDIIQFYKNLQCYLYQCSEYNLTEDDLYKKLSSVKDALAIHIISNLEEYKNSSWGFDD